MDIVLQENDNIDMKNDNLFRLLDRGIDDMEEGRELPIDEAFNKVSELRNTRRNARV